QMSRNYQREDRDWRRQQPSYQEEDPWSNSRSDDDFSMGLGQESRGSRGEDHGRQDYGRQDYGRRGQESGRSSGREGMRRPSGQQSSGYGDMGDSSRGQRFGSSFRGRERDFYGSE